MSYPMHMENPSINAADDEAVLAFSVSDAGSPKPELRILPEDEISATSHRLGAEELERKRRQANGG